MQNPTIDTVPKIAKALDVGLPAHLRPPVGGRRWGRFDKVIICYKT